MSQTTGFPPISLSFFFFFQLCLSLGVDIVNMGVSILLGVHDLQTKQGHRIMKVLPKGLSPAPPTE